MVCLGLKPRMVGADKSTELLQHPSSWFLSVIWVPIWIKPETFGFFLQTGDEMSKRSKFVFVTWVGPSVSVMKKAKMSTDKALMKDVIQVRMEPRLASVGISVTQIGRFLQVLGDILSHKSSPTILVPFGLLLIISLLCKKRVATFWAIFGGN